MSFSIRTALLAIAVLGLATCLLALYALVKPLAAANSGRIERAQDSVEAEVRRLQLGRPAPSSGSTGRGLTLRSGLVQPAAIFGDLGLPWPEAPGLLRDAIAESARTHEPALARVDVAGGVLFVAVAPAGDRYAWAGYVMAPARWTPLLRVVGVALAIVALALVMAAVLAVLAVRRDAAALTECLGALGHDLSTPIPRSRIRELSTVADGVAGLARDLERAQHDLAERERFAVLGRVTAGVAHELRNPLAVMKLRIDLVRRNPNVPGDVVRDLADVGDEVLRLDRLVNDLLTVAGRKLGELRDEDLGDLARRRVEVLKPLAAKKGVDVEVIGSAHVKVDADALARLVDNLAKNAIESAPKGSTVRVNVLRADLGVALRCIDGGDGVPADREHELFEPFFTTKPDGVGLGLALSKAIAMAHGGTLTYAHERGETIFELRLPEAA